MSAALRRVVVIAANPAEMRPALGQTRGPKPHSHIAELKNLRGARVPGDQSQQRVDLAVGIANENQLVLSQHRFGSRSLAATSLPRISCRRSLSNTHLPQAHSLALPGLLKSTAFFHKFNQLQQHAALAWQMPLETV